jgi:hypothetical protein
MFRVQEDLMSFFDDAELKPQSVITGGKFDLQIVYLGAKDIDSILSGGRGRYDGTAKIWIQKNNKSNKVQYVIKITPGPHWGANQPQFWPQAHIPNALNQINSEPLLLLQKLKQLGVNVRQTEELEHSLSVQKHYQAPIEVAEQQMMVAEQQMMVAKQQRDEANRNLQRFIDEIKADCDQFKWTFVPESIHAGQAGHAGQALPRGWSQQIDQYGKFYYVNQQTGATQWNRPVLPAGWSVFTDASSGNVYYSDGSITQWNPPE